MRSTHLLRGACAVIGVGALVAVGSGTAVGADPAPTPCGGVFNFKDGKNDQVDHTQAPSADQTKSTDLLGGFLLHEPAKGAEATSLNIVINDLKAEVPANYMSMTHFGNYVFDGKQYFLRAITDFTGAQVFEWGEFTPNPAGLILTGVSQYKGATTGAYFEGPNGVVKIVIPQDAGGKTGSQLTSIYTSAGQSRTNLPTAFPPYATRGTTPVLDNAPDAAGESTVKYSPTPCTVVGPVPGSGGTTVGSGSTTGGTTSGTSGGTGSGSGSGSTSGGGQATGGADPAVLPVTLASSKIKAPKGKKLSIKLSSKEELTNIGARLRKGSKAVGTGKLSGLFGKGTLKLKLSKKIKKGSYQLDLAGNLASGQRALKTLKVKLR